MSIECEVTRYEVVDGELVYNAGVERTQFHVRDGNLYLHNCKAVAPLSGLQALTSEGHGWCAQDGTQPTYVEPCSGAPRPCGPDCGCGPGDDVGGWGGRNYPRIYITPAELARVMKEVKSCTTR